MCTLEITVFSMVLIFTHFAGLPPARPHPHLLLFLLSRIKDFAPLFLAKPPNYEIDYIFFMEGEPVHFSKIPSFHLLWKHCSDTYFEQMIPKSLWQF